MWEEEADNCTLESENITNIKNPFNKHKDHHNKHPTSMVFYVIHQIKGHWRGDNKRISQNETKWIFPLDTLQPAAMNIHVHFNCFLTHF